MKHSGMDMEIADDSAHEQLFVELYHDGRDWGRVTHEGGRMLLEIYPKVVAGGDALDPDSFWVFELVDVLAILQQAREELAE